MTAARLRRSLNRPLVGLLVLYLASSFFMIAQFPKAWTDTSWVAVRGYTLATEGRVAVPFLRGVEHRDEHVLAPHVVQPVLLALTYKLAGFGLWQSRLPSILAGFLLALLTYWFAQKYYGRNVALVALTLLILDNIFFVSSRVVRPEIFLTLFSTASFLFLYHAFHKGSLRHVMLAGASIGVGLYTHPHALLILLAILLLFVHRFKLAIIRAKEFWWFVLFALLAFSPYAAYVVREDFSNGFSHFAEQLSRKKGLTERNYLQDVLLELRRYEDYMYFPYRVLVLSLQLVALVCGFFSRRGVDKQLSFVVLVVVAFFPILRPYNGNSLYLVILLPFLSILIASLLFRVKGRVDAPGARRGPWLLRTANAVVILYALNGLCGNAGALYLHRHCDFDGFFHQIRKQIPPGSRIVGNMDFWLGLHDYPYVTPESPAASVAAFRPEYAVLYDPSTWKERTAITGRPRANVANALPDNADATLGVLKARATLVGRVESDDYGHVEIHALRWDE